MSGFKQGGSNSVSGRFSLKQKQLISGIGLCNSASKKAEIRIPPLFSVEKMTRANHQVRYSPIAGLVPQSFRKYAD